MNSKKLYEKIMRNVVIEVSKAIYEADKKSEALIKAESKLSQDEKVDLWIAGKRNINLDACSADKLRKYYKIVKAKDFASGVAQIERVAKSKNIKLDKELKESVAGKVVYEEWVDINTDALFVGDIGYALDEKIYFGVWVDMQHTPDGFVTDGETIYAVVGGTAYGDGVYYDEHRHEFGVDVGVIGVTDLNYIDPSMTKEKLNNLGLVIEVPSGHANVEYYNSEGLISIKIWDKASKKTLYLGEIDTRSEEDDEVGLRKATNESVEADSSFGFLFIDNKDNTETIQCTSDCMSDDEHIFFEYCKNTYKPQRYEFTYEIIEDTRVFPIIYEIGNDFVTIECLHHNTTKCNKWINSLDEDFHGRTVREWIKVGCMPKTMNKTAALKFRADVLCWGLRVTNELEKIGYDTSMLFEICTDNIAERQNGDIVMILPPSTNKIQNNMNKQKLYESIMANVAKEVKKALNENYEYIPPKFINDEIIDNTQLNKMAIKFVKDTDMREYKDLVKSLCGEYVNDYTIRRNTQYKFANIIYKKFRTVDVYDLYKIDKVSPGSNSMEISANEYIYLRSEEIVGVWKYLCNNKNILYKDLTPEFAYKLFVKYVYEFLRDMYI